MIAGALMLIGIGLALVAGGIYWFDAGRMVDLTDEGIALLQARPHDANEILPSPFGRVTAPIFWLVRHNLSAFRIAGFLIMAFVAAVLIGLVIRSRTRGRVAIAITGGIAAATMYYAEYVRTPNYNWVVGIALGLAAIGFVIVVAPPNTVARLQPWHRDLIAGSILGSGIALTLTARIHSAAVAAIVIASAWSAWLLTLRARHRDISSALAQVLRVTGICVSTTALWVLFALILPAGGLGPLRRDVRNGVDWLSGSGSTSTSKLSRYPHDARELFRALGTSLGAQAVGVAIGVGVAILILWPLITTKRHRRDRYERLGVWSTSVVALMTASALGGALLSALVRGDVHGGYSTTATPQGPMLVPSTFLGLTFLAALIWAIFGRFAGVAWVAYLSRQADARRGEQIPTPTFSTDAPADASRRSAEVGWVFLTATLLGLAVAASVGSGNPMAYQLRYGNVPLFGALACVVCQWNGGKQTAIGIRRRELAGQLLVAILCVTFGLFALRWVLDARTNPYKGPPLSTPTKSSRSSATGITVELPRSQSRGLEHLERQANRAGWRPGTSLLDLTPFRPFLTFWLGADPPFSVYPVVESGRAKDSLLLTISRESEDNLHDAWLLVSSPLMGDIDYSTIASALGRPWPCGYESVARANVGTEMANPDRVELLRPAPGPVPRTCAAIENTPK